MLNGFRTRRGGRRMLILPYLLVVCEVIAGVLAIYTCILRVNLDLTMPDYRKLKRMERIHLAFCLIFGALALLM
jgi:hypothetical protein